MRYLESSFTVGPPASLDGIACEQCVYGRGEHAEGCLAVVESDESYEASEALLNKRARLGMGAGSHTPTPLDREVLRAAATWPTRRWLW
jgi:hypothetical protein